MLGVVGVMIIILVKSYDYHLVEIAIIIILIRPVGRSFLDSFWLPSGVPVWDSFLVHFGFSGFILEKRIWSVLRGMEGALKNKKKVAG